MRWALIIPPTFLFSKSININTTKLSFFFFLFQVLSYGCKYYFLFVLRFYSFFLPSFERGLPKWNRFPPEINRLDQHQKKLPKCHNKHSMSVLCSMHEWTHAQKVMLKSSWSNQLPKIWQHIRFWQRSTSWLDQEIFSTSSYIITYLYFVNKVLETQGQFFWVKLQEILFYFIFFKAVKILEIK